MVETVQDLLAPGSTLPGDGLADPPTATILPDLDAREHALRRLAQFISLVTFQRTGARAPPGQLLIRFKVPSKNIHLYEPDDIKSLPFPSMGFLAGVGVHEPFGLGPPVVCDDSLGVFAPGTTLLSLGEYVENITVEVWGSKHAERRALAAGLKQMFRIVDSSYSLRLSLPSYFDQVAQFTLMESQPIDDMAVRNRRRAHLMVEMRVPEVALVDAVTFQPVIGSVSVEAASVIC